MILDLHVHSVYSGDSPVSPEDYARRVLELQSEYEISGFVLTEHNHLITPAECDLPALSAKYGITILPASELDTYWGHLLVYGMSGRLWEELRKGARKKQEPVRFCRTAAEDGAVVVPAHPFRFFLGLGERSRELEGIRLLETRNGSNSAEENQAAENLARKMGWGGTGGSDAHFLPELGKALTRFERPVTTAADLVRELQAGRCRACSLEEARRRP